jgi:mRNA-degrading endonuclease RelE of RelBE toxin-antitoxin system
VKLSYILEKEVKKLIEAKQNQLKAVVKDNELAIAGDFSIYWKNGHRDAYQVKESDFRIFKIQKQEKTS